MLNLRYTALWLSLSVIWCNIEALNKLRFKMIKKCLKKVNIFELPALPYSIFLIDCSVMKTVLQTVFKICNSNHKYLDNQTGNRLVKVKGFLTDLKVYNFHSSMC